MRPFRIALLATALTLSSCTASHAPRPRVLQVDSIPLIISASGPNSRLIEIDVQVDEQLQRLLFDTGAASSSVGATPFTNRYPVQSSSESEGVSGKSQACDIIQPKRVVVGKHVFYQPKLKRCARGLFGIDFLRNLAFRIDMKSSEFAIIEKLPLGQRRYRLKQLRAGHITIPMNIGAANTNGFFDTGADITVVDADFMQQHAEDFDFVRPDTGIDGNGNTIKSGIYRCRIMEIGPLKLRNVEVAVFDFGDPMRQEMDRIPIILGTDAIAKAQWNFDLAAAQWSAQPYD